MGSTASILPIYKKFFIDKSSSGAVPITPPYLNEKTFWIYKENQNIDQNKVIEISSTIQKWIDQGISMELVLNLKNGLNAKSIYDLYLNAWKSKCKTVYYARSIIPNVSEITSHKEGTNKDMNKNKNREKPECLSCAN
jgi:ribonucleoside-diphosphate reductase alpha chain